MLCGYPVVVVVKSVEDQIKNLEEDSVLITIIRPEKLDHYYVYFVTGMWSDDIETQVCSLLLRNT